MGHLPILAGLRRSARLFVKTPGFAVSALLAMVLGVSASTAVFSLINAALLRSLPYRNVDRLVYMWTPLPSAAGLPRELPPFYKDIAAWRKTSRSFVDITAFAWR